MVAGSIVSLASALNCHYCTRSREIHCHGNCTRIRDATGDRDVVVLWPTLCSWEANWTQVISQHNEMKYNAEPIAGAL